MKNLLSAEGQAGLDALRIPVQIADTEGTIVYSNAADSRRIGCEPGALVGTKIWDKLPTARERKSLQQDLGYLIEHQPPAEPYINRDIDAQGNLRPQRVIWDYIRDEDGTLQGFISCFIDIPEAERLKDLSAYSQGVVAAQEAERKRIVRDLHDSVLQQLAVITMQISSSTAPMSASGVAQLLRDLRAVTDELRSITDEIRPSALSDLGLAPALRELCTTLKTASGIEIEIDAAISARLPDEVADNLFRIAQEGLSNALQHSCGSRVWLTLSQSETTVELVISDNGQGMVVGATPTGGLGLLHIRERVALVGGEVTIDSSSAGLSLSVTIPLSRG